MAKEIEVKILNVDPGQIRERLAWLKAMPIRPMFKQKRYVFDINPSDKNRWIRLRDDGRATTLAVKLIRNARIDGTDEFETEVTDLRATLEILRQLGYRPKSYQENYRELYELDGAEISIDRWPKLEPYVEIEASTKKEVKDILKKLNIENNDTTSVNTKDLYLKKGYDLDKRKNLIFSQAEERSIKQPETE